MILMRNGDDKAEALAALIVWKGNDSTVVMIIRRESGSGNGANMDSCRTLSSFESVRKKASNLRLRAGMTEEGMVMMKDHGVLEAAVLGEIGGIEVENTHMIGESAVEVGIDTVTIDEGIGVATGIGTMIETMIEEGAIDSKARSA